MYVTIFSVRLYNDTFGAAAEACVGALHHLISVLNANVKLCLSVSATSSTYCQAVVVGMRKFWSILSLFITGELLLLLR